MWTFILLSVCVTISLSMALAYCLCWKKKTHKNDLLGLDGMVTQKNPDENVNHLPSAAPCVIDVLNSAAATANPVDITDSSAKRSVPATNTRRSLPDIPAEQEVAVNWEPTGDNSSEHYATVGQYRNAKRHTLSNGVEARPSISQHSSISQADDGFSPYEKVKYDKIKSKEHSYAQLQPTTSRQAIIEESKLISEERNSFLRPEVPGTSAEPLAPPRSRRSSTHSGLGVDIPAASAVAGGIAASPDLPYMTPPVTQANFSGDSQDSSKGYTSISVREPLANIIAQTKEMSKKRDLDQHYSTVSDDSDDVYTTIPDPNQIYTSESETYARIPAHPITVEAEVNVEPTQALQNDELYEPPPQTPPQANLKQIPGHSHSRQASSSSSIANIGSPKPEKRQANSPLPPPPATSFDFHVDKVQKNLDDLYAKVHKTKKDEESENEKTPEKNRKSTSDNLSRKSVSSSSGGSNSLADDKKHFEPKRKREHNYETLRKTTKERKCSDPGYEKIQQEEPGYASINGPESLSSSDPGYEVLKQRPPSEIDPNYEELKDNGSLLSNASDCAGYTKIKYSQTTLAGDGYSVVNKQRKCDEKSRTSSSYESNSQDLSVDEPNYESMPSESLSSSEHNYAALKSTTGSESDPNYESVNQPDPNYESVRDLDEPPYERLNDDDSSKTDSENIHHQGYEKISRRGYENIDTSESSNGGGSSSVKSDSLKKDSEPPYEKLSNDIDCDLAEKGKSNNNNNGLESANSSNVSGKNEPNYSTIKTNNIVVNSNSNNLHEEDGIVQV